MESTRDRILGTALAAFADRGYNAAGVQELCGASGVTKPTLYYHFGSKRGLLEAIEAELYQPFVQRVGDEAQYRGDVAAALGAVLGVFLDWAREKPDFTRLRLSLAFSPPASEAHAVFRPATDALYARLRGFFDAAAEDHGNMRGRSLPYAASFVGTADAYAGLALAGAFLPDAEGRARIVHYFMHGIFS